MRVSAPGALVFRSKADWWLVVVMLGSVTACGVVGVLSLVRESGTVRWLLAGPMFGSAGLQLWVLAATDYTLTRDELRVRCGPFGWRIDIGEIRSVAPTRSPLSSPALSLDRLRIDYGASRSIMISPRQRDAFLRDLSERRGPKAPH